jgi:hypothetical protein
MNYALKTVFLTTSLFSAFTFSFQESENVINHLFEESDDTARALDKILLPYDLIESIKNNEFCSNDLLGIANKLGLWDLCSKPPLEEMLYTLTKHHAYIDKSHDLEKFSTDNLEKYALLCQERLSKVYKDHLFLLKSKKAYYNHITIIVPIALLMFGLIQLNKTAKTILVSSILLALAFVADDTWSTTNKDMAYMLLENLYEITHSFLTQKIQSRQKHNIQSDIDNTLML